jgi:protein-disulfide isomerase
MTRTLALVALVVAATLGGFLWSARGGGSLPAGLISPAQAQEAAAEAPAIEIPDMVLGSEDAPLTVIEYASFTCPHCGNFHANTFDRFKAEYIDTGKVRFVYREVFFDKYGLWAAMVARCGGEMKYFGIADIIYDTQREWIGEGQDAEIAENLRKIGLKAGIDQDALDACLKDAGMAKALVANYQEKATADGVESTPTFIVGGDKHAGDMSFEEFSAILDAKLGS